MGPVIAFLDAPKIGKRYVEFLTLLDEQMPVARLLLEKESCCGNPMMKRDGLDKKRIILVNHLGLLWVEGLEGNLHREIGTKIVEQRLEYPFCILLCMDHYLSRALPQSERGNKPD